MNPYNDIYLKATLCLAFSGNSKAKKQICSIKMPYAVSSDFSQLLVVIEERPFESDIEPIKKMNNYRAEIYRCSESLLRGQPSLSWTYIPIPNTFNVQKITCDNGIFTLHSINGDLIQGTLKEIISAMRYVVSYSNFVTEDEIETSFYSLRST